MMRKIAIALVATVIVASGVATVARQQKNAATLLGVPRLAGCGVDQPS
jgi:hypothetical protein